MARRGGYWITEKWVYDAAARRRANKAHDVLGRVEYYLLTHGPVYGDVDVSEELAYEDAFAIVKAASAAVAAEERAAHATVKASSR